MSDGIKIRDGSRFICKLPAGEWKLCAFAMPNDNLTIVAMPVAGDRPPLLIRDHLGNWMDPPHEVPRAPLPKLEIVR